MTTCTICGYKTSEYVSAGCRGRICISCWSKKRMRGGHSYMNRIGRLTFPRNTKYPTAYKLLKAFQVKQAI